MNLLKALPAIALPCALVGAQTPAPPKALSPAYAALLVRRALAFAKAYGIDKLIEETNKPTGQFHVSSGGELYILIYDMEGNCKAIGFGTEQYVGKNRFDYKDPDGKMVVQEFIKTVKTKGRGWVEYKYPNPVTGKTDAKVTLVQGYEGLVIGAGTYKDDSVLPD